MENENIKYGYVSIYRSIFNSYLWTDDTFSRGQAWIDLLLLANHKPNKIRVRGQLIPIGRGQVGYSTVKLAKRWGWSRGKVTRFLNELEIEQQIVQQKNNVTTVSTITNYEQYQNVNSKQYSKQTADDTANGQQTVQQTDTNNKVNKINKEIKKEKRERFTPPTLCEVEEYIFQKNYEVNPRRWYDFYQSKGWMVGKNKMKDWKAAIRTWTNRKNYEGAKNGQSAKFNKPANQSYADQQSAYGIEIKT